MEYWYGNVAWGLLCVNLVCYHYCKEYETQYRDIEDKEEFQDQRIVLMVDHLWDKYDENGDQVLSRAECRKFIKAILRKGDTLNDQRFEVLFKEIDKDNSNTIDKSEMVAFLQTLYADQGDVEAQQQA